MIQPSPLGGWEIDGLSGASAAGLQHNLGVSYLGLGKSPINSDVSLNMTEILLTGTLNCNSTPTTCSETPFKCIYEC